MVEVVRYCFNLKECSVVIYQFLQGLQCKKAVSMENLKTGLITQVFSISSMTQAVSHSNLQFWLLLMMQTRTPHILKCLSYPRTILVSVVSLIAWNYGGFFHLELCKDLGLMGYLTKLVTIFTSYSSILTITHLHSSAETFSFFFSLFWRGHVSPACRVSYCWVFILQCTVGVVNLF